MTAFCIDGYGRTATFMSQRHLAFLLLDFQPYCACLERPSAQGKALLAPTPQTRSRYGKTLTPAPGPNAMSCCNCLARAQEGCLLRTQPTRCGTTSASLWIASSCVERLSGAQKLNAPAMTSLLPASSRRGVELPGWGALILQCFGCRGPLLSLYCISAETNSSDALTMPL